MKSPAESAYTLPPLSPLPFLNDKFFKHAGPPAAHRGSRDMATARTSRSQTAAWVVEG